MINRIRDRRIRWPCVDSPGFSPFGPFSAVVEVQRKGHRIYETVSGPDRFELEIDHFYRCIQENLMLMTDGEEAALKGRVVEAILQPTQQGRSIRL